MARIVVICDSAPLKPTDGLHLRVQNLVVQLAGRNECFYFGASADSGEEQAFYDLGFSDTAFVDRRPRSGRRWRRHFRLSNENFLRMSSPHYYQSVSTALSGAMRRWRPDVLVSFAPALSEIGMAAELPRLLDYTDCQTLAFRRALDNRRADLSLLDRARSRLKMKRQAGRERALLRGYDLTTTISEADRRALLDISGVPGERVIVLPNGVADKALVTGECVRNPERSVIFWGNLDFPPNWTAVKYFYDKIFMPFLSGKGITWHIVGGGASSSLLRHVNHPEIQFHGFVDDLYDFAAGQGAMINPMVEGSGMKNKVLEAFALNLPVISTPMGVEAISGEHGVHYLVADSPEQFALHVQRVLDDEEMRQSIVSAGRDLAESRYTWAAIGEIYQHLLESAMSRNVVGQQSGTV